MSARVISPVTYFVVLVALIALTCLTVGLSFLSLNPRWHFTLGMLIAICKASLVALFFMHLIHSRPSIWSVVCVSVFWAVIVLGGLTFSDYLTRAWIPFIPGH